MEFYEAVNRRRTVREFEDREIPPEIIKKIIAAGLKAPSNDHLRDWHFVIVTEKKKAAELLEPIPKGITEEELRQLFEAWNLRDPLQRECYRRAVPKQYRMLYDAPVLLVPLLKQKTDLLHPENASHLNGFASVWCCIENIFLAASAEGLGCSIRIPLGGEAEHAGRVLAVPKEYYIPCFIGIGIPKENAEAVKQKAIDPEERIHWQKF